MWSACSAPGHRDMQPSARITLVRVTGRLRIGPDELERLSALLARAERVDCAAFHVDAKHVAPCLPLLHVVPREVLVLWQGWYEPVGLKLVVAAAAPGGGYTAGPRNGAAATAAATAAAAAAAAARLQQPTVDELLGEAVGLMEVRARAGDSPQEQQQGMEQARGLGRVNKPSGCRAACGQGDGAGTSCEDVMEHWWEQVQDSEASGEVEGAEAAGEGEGIEAGHVLVLSGPGMCALAAHSMEAGEAALKGALGKLSRSHPGDRQRRMYRVLPCGGGVLLQWDGGDVAEAAAEVVRGAAVQLGLEGPEVLEGGVRAVALPHCNLAA